ncbi:MAG: hypothetical protein WCV73_04005 [Patescibacteria group bacterium]|jgi:hypothetical protein
MSRKKIIIIAISVLVLAGLAVALLLMDGSWFAPKVAPVNNNNNATTTLPQVNKGAIPLVPKITLKPQEQAVSTVARNFAERFGSYSTDSQMVNLDELGLISTAKMQTTLVLLKTELKKQYDPAKGFYGVSSRALKIAINDLDENQGTAQVTVSLQRSERKDGAVDYVYYQDVVLSLVKSGDVWLVDSAKWQE